MKSVLKPFLLLFCIVLSSAQLNGKPTGPQDIGIRGKQVVAASNQSACMEISVFNFNAVTALGFKATWDETDLRFDSISGANILGLDASDFGNFDQTSSGLLQLDWQAGTGENATLEDGDVLYQICFTVISGGGFFDPVQFPVELSDGSAQNLGAANPALILINGEVGRYMPSTAGSNFAMELEIADITLQANQDTCISIDVVRFQDVLGFQFTIAWDSTLLQLNNIQLGNSTLPGYDLTDFNTPDAGTVTHAWLNSTTLSGVTQVPGTTLFDLCFSSTGELGLSSVTFGGIPTAIEAYTGDTEIFPMLGQGAFVFIPDLNVWPGDTDRNGIVNNFDLLPIGIAYDAAGPQRPNASLNWTAQAAPDWLQNTPATAINYKHIDTNGNGAINSNDTLAIAQNWGLEIPGFRPGTPQAEPRFMGASLYLKTDTLETGQAGTISIFLGDSQVNAENVYGVAFSVVYDPDAVESGSLFCSFDNSWLGQPDNELLTLYRVFPADNRVDIALTRTDGLNVSGNGVIGQLKFNVPGDFLAPFTPVSFSIENIRLIDRDEMPFTVEAITTTIWIEGSTATQNPELARLIHLYPTPASSQVILETKGVQITAVQVLDAYGRTVKSADPASGRIAVQDLADGVYVVRLETDKGIIYKSLMVNK